MSNSIHPTCQTWFAEGGRLSEFIQGYQPRQAQLEMASQVLQGMQEPPCYTLLEAGTGVGKTLAYLLPSIYSDKRIVIATATKLLQKQLFEKDIPLAIKVYGGGINVALLKGRENYLSTERLQRAWEDLALLNPLEQQHLKKIQAWSENTKTGDYSECTGVPNDSILWRWVCTKSHDKLSPDDFYSKARQNAKEVDLLIVNQHLLCAELTLLDEIGSQSLLSPFDTIIIDEAHQFNDIATMMFSQKCTTYRIQEITKDCIKAILAEIPTFEKQLTPKVLAINANVERITQHFKQYQLGRHSWRSFYQHTDLTWLTQFLATLEQVLAELKPHDQDNILKAKQQLQQLRTFFLDYKKLTEDSTIAYKVGWLDIQKNGHICWYITPISITEKLQQQRENYPKNWIFTSATLSVNDKFNHIIGNLGLPDNTTQAIWQSPFNFKQQVAWYQLKDLPPVNQPEHIEQFILKLVPVIELCQGRSFLLFCSYRAMYQAFEILNQKTELELFVQGTESNQQLIKAFNQRPNSVLLGTSSFWEGVDIRGQNLSFVAIDKLPFASPTDPLTAARDEWYRQQGKNAFACENLPRAVVALKQGLGRLIRDSKDYGIVALGDTRIYSKSYSQTFINSLPDYQIIEDFPELKAFWQQHANNETIA